MNATQSTADEIAQSLKDFIKAYAERVNSTVAVNPGHRRAFHWPPTPVSYAYHLLASDWSGHATFEAHGETFDVDVARTRQGVFGRCRQLWHEARGKSTAEMLKNLAEAAEVLFARQFEISDCLGLDYRFSGHISDLTPLQLLMLLYSKDRDIANEARIEIETHASSKVFAPSLIAILNDRTHPHRRSAQWCVLDLFEDIRSFCDTADLESQALEAMKQLLWDADNDYARTVYKAGVVLGGHLPKDKGGPILIECLRSPSRFGRRAAIHGLFHVVEWDASSRPEVLRALREFAKSDEDSGLREYATAMAADIANEKLEHIAEPVFSEEL